MRTIWFSEWTDTPMHKVVYQTAIGSAVAVACVAFMKITGVPLNAKRWLALPVSTIAVFATGFLIHSFVWRKYTPYVTLEGSRLLHSQGGGVGAASCPLLAESCLVLDFSKRVFDHLRHLAWGAYMAFNRNAFNCSLGGNYLAGSGC